LRVGYYDESLKIVADWKLLVLAILKHNVTYRKVDAVFYFQRRDKFVARKSTYNRN
jgi:hypothetical protein